MDDLLDIVLRLGGGWPWLILAGLLFVLEILAPGLSLMWFGVAAMAVGLLTFAVDLTWTWQLVSFALASLVSLLAGHLMWGGHRHGGSDRPLLNKRALQLVGRSYVLDTAIIGGRGRVQIGDTLWTVTGPDLPAGEQIRITGADGTVLVVEPLGAGEAGPKLPKAGSFSG